MRLLVLFTISGVFYFISCPVSSWECIHTGRYFMFSLKYSVILNSFLLSLEKRKTFICWIYHASIKARLRWFYYNKFNDFWEKLSAIVFILGWNIALSKTCINKLYKYHYICSINVLMFCLDWQWSSYSNQHIKKKLVQWRRHLTELQ